MTLNIDSLANTIYICEINAEKTLGMLIIILTLPVYKN